VIAASLMRGIAWIFSFYRFAHRARGPSPGQGAALEAENLRAYSSG